jgi:SAM-dependent methyltransferase
MKTWIDFYNSRASCFDSPEEIGCHYLDNKRISPEYTTLEEERIKEILQPKANSTAYDLGCGAGYSSMLLAKYFKFVIGLDGGEQTIQKATHYNDNIKFIRDDISELNAVSNNSIDFALLYGVIYNMGPISSVISFSKNLSLKCNRGSRILICKIPNSKFFDSYQKYRNDKKNERNYTDDSNLNHNLEWLWFSTSEIENLFKDHFEIINILPNPSVDFPLKAWFDTLLIKK